jgi:hypothetical protein
MCRFRRRIRDRNAELLGRAYYLGPRRSLYCACYAIPLRARWAAVSVVHLTMREKSLPRPRGMTELRI